MQTGHNSGRRHREVRRPMQLRLIVSENPLARGVIYTEWMLLGFSVVMEALAWNFSHVSKINVDICLLSLALVSCMSIHWPEKKSISYKLVFILAELFLVTLVSAVGTTRWTWPLYLAVVARGAVLLEGRYLWPIVAVALVSQESWYIARWMFTQPVPGMPITLWTCLLSVFMLTGTFGVLIVVVGWLMSALMAEQRLRQETQRLSRENENLAAQLERTRIAREIHDTLGHSLTSLKIQLELSKRLMPVDRERANAALEQAEQLAARSLTDTRVALQGVRNNDFDLRGAVADLAEEIERGGRLKIESRLDPVDLSNAAAYQLYRVIQESTTNTLKHAGASKVSLHLSQHDGAIVLEIADDGAGFEVGKTSDGFGLQGMKERLGSIGGTVVIDSAPQCGTRVKVVIPVEKSEAVVSDASSSSL